MTVRTRLIRLEMSSDRSTYFSWPSFENVDIAGRPLFFIWVDSIWYRALFCHIATWNFKIGIRIELERRPEPGARWVVPFTTKKLWQNIFKKMPSAIKYNCSGCEYITVKESLYSLSAWFELFERAPFIASSFISRLHQQMLHRSFSDRHKREQVSFFDWKEFTCNPTLLWQVFFSTYSRRCVIQPEKMLQTKILFPAYRRSWLFNLFPPLFLVGMMKVPPTTSKKGPHTVVAIAVIADGK